MFCSLDLMSYLNWIFVNEMGCSIMVSVVSIISLTLRIPSRISALMLALSFANFTQI